MSRQISERAAFYLKHQRRIEEWTKLGDEVHVEAHDFFVSLLEPLEAELVTLKGSPAVFMKFDRKEPPKLFLIRPSWRGTGTHPIVGIGLEWSTKPNFTDSYIGVWLDRSKKGKSERLHPQIVASATLNLKGAGSRAKPPAYRTGKTWFPVHRHEAPSGAYWEPGGLDGFAEHLVNSITSLWTATWSDIDAIIVSDEGPE